MSHSREYLAARVVPGIHHKTGSTTNVIPAQAGIQYSCGRTLIILCHSSESWNPGVLPRAIFILLESLNVKTTMTASTVVFHSNVLRDETRFKTDATEGVIMLRRLLAPDYRLFARPKISDGLGNDCE